MYHSLNDVNIVQYQNPGGGGGTRCVRQYGGVPLYKWASAQREFNNPQICFWAAKRENLVTRK